MLPAILGLVGIGLGAVLTALLSADREQRDRRVEALSGLVAANARVIVAHERLYELVANGHPPDPESEVAQSALQERTSALAEWRTVHGKVLVLVPVAPELDSAIGNFMKARALGTRWVRAYQRHGASFEIGSVAEVQRTSWKRMHNAHHEVIAAARRVVADDLRPWPRRLHNHRLAGKSSNMSATGLATPDR